MPKSSRSGTLRGRYRITKVTLALFPEDGGYVGRPLPEGASIAFDPANLSSAVLVEVTWLDSTILMFAEDLKAVAVQEDGPS
jgi:hypothetical protein